MLDVYSERNDLCFENIYYEIGSFALSDDFDGQLIGKKSNSSDIYNITIDNDVIEINITLKGIYKLAESTSKEDILKFYGYKSLEEVMNFIRKRAADEILYDYMMNYVLENSDIKYFPKAVENNVSKAISELDKEASKEKQSLSDYLQQNNTTLENIKNEMYNYYFEILVCEAILYDENMILTNDDIKNKIKQIALENEMDEYEIYNYYTEDDIYYQVLNDKVRSILISYAIITTDD